MTYIVLLGQAASDIRGLKGKIGLVESGTWGGSQDDRPREDFEAKRVGANPPPVLVTLRADAQASMFAAAGTPVLTSYQDGTAMRESMRRFLHSTIQPVADVALVELRLKLESPDLALDFSRLFASDLSGRARAFGSLVQGGMSLADAAQVTGVLVDDNP